MIVELLSMEVGPVIVFTVGPVIAFAVARLLIEMQERFDQYLRERQ